MDIAQEFGYLLCNVQRRARRGEEGWCVWWWVGCFFHNR